MCKFKIRVTEVLVKVVDVEADSVADAIASVAIAYDNEDIVLSADDFLNVDIADDRGDEDVS